MARSHTGGFGVNVSEPLKIGPSRAARPIMLRDVALPAGQAGRFEELAKRRFQDPTPTKKGKFWYIRVRQDISENGRTVRKLVRLKIAPASMLEREAKKVAAEMLRPMNQGLISIGSAINFRDYVENEYIPTILPLLGKCTADAYKRALKNASQASAWEFLPPRFNPAFLLQHFFSNMKLGHPTIVKNRDALSSVLRSAVPDFIVKNPLDGLRLPPDKRGRRSKPVISPQQFTNLAELVPEPYSTMCTSPFGQFSEFRN